MGFKNGIIIGIGVIVFLYAGDTSRKAGLDDPISFFGGLIVFLAGLILVYLGLKLEQDEKKGKSK